MNQDQEKAKQEAKKEVMSSYVKLLKKNRVHPTKPELLAEGHDKDKIRRLFGNMKFLRAETKETFPEAFKDMVDTDDFTEENLNKLKKQIAKYSRLVITSAVNGCRVHPGLMQSIDLYCKKNDAFLIVIPTHDPAHNLDNAWSWSLDGSLKNHIVYDEIQLNDNLFISDIRLSAKQINPTTGLGRVCQQAGSFIFGSPKQSLEFYSVDMKKFPHAMMSTGAVTVPNYRTSKFMSERMAYIAECDHIMGGLIIEIEDDEVFHFRQFQADAQGGFADLGKFYKGDKVVPMRPDLVLGDWHSGDVDPTAKLAWFELAKHVNVRDGYVHDLFNGASINHHERDNKIASSKKALENKLTLEDELKVTGQDLNELSKKFEKVYIVRSNHDEFLTRWLADGAHFYEPQNYRLGCELSLQAIDGVDPVKYGIMTRTKLENPEKIVWLGRNDGRRVAKIELGAHGDKGLNGLKNAGMQGLERSYGKAVTAHSHSPAILRGVFRVGTSTKLRLSYNDGASTWFHTSCLVYPNGQRQLVNSIMGKWHL